MVNNVVIQGTPANLDRHSGAARSAEPGILSEQSARSRVRANARPGMTRFRASLLRLAGILHRLEGREFDVVEFAVDLLDLADVDILHDVAGLGINRDRAARALPLHALHGC